MARRHKLWAQTCRKRMIAQLGGCCRCCGAVQQLEFDCCDPMGDAHHRRSSPERCTFYREQMRIGNLQVLCNVCNAIKGATPLHIWLTAIGYMNSREARQRNEGTPGGGTAFSSDEKREAVRSWMSNNIWTNSNEP